MSISNYGELKTAVADYTKRRDLTARIPDFIQAAHVRIVEYAGQLSQMTADEDTNELLSYNASVYLYGALAEAFAYLRDMEMLMIYQTKFEHELSNLAMTGFDTIDGIPNGPVI